MKNYILLVIFCFFFLSGLLSQAKTIELNPQFYLENKEFVSEVVAFDVNDDNLDFIALSCYHFDIRDLPLYYRLKRENQFSEWIPLEQIYEFVASNRSTYRANPIKQSFEAIQFKSQYELESSLTVRFFLAGHKKFTPPPINKSLNCELPTVCERDCWCPTCPVDNTPEFTEPTHLIVHHSAAHNDSDNYALVVESIWDFHVNTNGWDDIGYNWLIDPDGVLYQGRPDGYQGAHFSCINENTVGICVIGDYSLITPSDDAINALVNLLAYEATEHDIDIEAESYHETGEFTLTNLAGHRDSGGSLNACSGTVCPGDSFYPMLPDIRLQIADLPCYAEPVSTSESIDDLEVSIFPNPVENQFYINTSSLENESFELVNIYGVSVGFVYANQINDVSNLNVGVYLVVKDGEVLGRLFKK